MWAWGWDGYGEVGNGAPTGEVAAPERITNSTTYTAVAGGTYHSLALDVDGNLWTWGYDFHGQVGNGAPTGDVTVPQQISTGTIYTAAAAGAHHSLALDADGNLWAWGYDGGGQLGNGTPTGDVTAPEQITTGTIYTAVAAGGFHSLALDVDGNLWAWGYDVYGQVGNGALTGDVTVPQQISTGAAYTAVTAGDYHSLALDVDGNLWAWGNDDSGQLGNGALTGDVTVPQQITTGTTYTAVTAGDYHSLALDADGNLWAWGYNHYGQVGNGASPGQVAAPVQITTGTTHTAAAGRFHSLALDSDGKMWAWGDDGNEQVGNGAATGDVTQPQRITSATVITSIAFDGVAGTALQRLSETRALVTTPPGTPGTATITIRYSYDGDPKPALTLVHMFTYVAATPTPPAARGGSASNANVSAPPTVTLQPSDAKVDAGDTVTFTLAADGNPLPTIQWQRSMDDGATWADLDGKTGSTLTLGATTDLDGTRYRAILTNEHGTAISDTATLSVPAGASPAPSVTPSPVASPSPTAGDPDGNAASSGIAGWLWIVAGIVLLLLLLLLASTLRTRRDA